MDDARQVAYDEDPKPEPEAKGKGKGKPEPKPPPPEAKGKGKGKEPQPALDLEPQLPVIHRLPASSWGANLWHVCDEVVLGPIRPGERPRPLVRHISKCWRKTWFPQGAERIVFPPGEVSKVSFCGECRKLLPEACKFK